MTIILFTKDSNGVIYGYDDNPNSQALAQQRVDEGQTIYVPPTPSQKQIDDEKIAETTILVNAQIQFYLDNGASNWGYDGIISGVSYITSNNAQFSSDGTLLSNWRDSVWIWAYAKYPLITPTTTVVEFMLDAPVQPKQIIV